MNWWKKFIKRFSPYNLVIIALVSAIGIAVKPFTTTFAHIITGPLYIPGGVVGGGLYMMWIVIGTGLVGIPGTATLIGIIQAFMVIILGSYGTHGALSLLTYSVPGVFIDLLLLFMRGHRHICCPLCAFLAGAVANIGGTVVVSLAFFNLPLIPLLLSITLAALSGGLGGLIAFYILSQLRKMDIMKVVTR
ncbi:MAG: ECF transporter S component [Tepidanaerobacteraceae bacterium]|jgi:hypothetical protein